MDYYLILQILSLIIIIVTVFILRYNLGYPIYFSMAFMQFPVYSAFYKQGIGFKVTKGSGYIIQKIKTKNFNNINFNLNNNIENGKFFVYLLDKNKNILLSFKNENLEKTLKLNCNENYYLKIIYEKINGKFDLNYKLY